MMMRATVEEDCKATMVRFLNGLNGDIANVVGLQYYVEMEDILHIAIQVEEQLKKKGGRSFFNSKPWKSNQKKDDKTSLKSKSVQPEQKQDDSHKNKGKFDTQHHYHVLRCFRCNGIRHVASQCANKKDMITLGNDQIRQ